jgi:hypothetical protein
MTEIAAAKANIFRRGLTKVTDYAKNIAHDYADVGKNIVEDAKKRPLKATVALSTIGMLGYSIKTNPSESEFRNRLCALRQRMALLPTPIHSSKAGKLSVDYLYIFQMASFLN